MELDRKKPDLLISPKHSLSEESESDEEKKGSNGKKRKRTESESNDSIFESDSSSCDDTITDQVRSESTASVKTLT